jgi:hypothetical protein
MAPKKEIVEVEIVICVPLRSAVCFSWEANKKLFNNISIIIPVEQFYQKCK